MTISRRAFRFALSVLLAVTASAPLVADTVLVHVHGNTRALTRQASVSQITAAFEDGLMIPLFERGHIVFNLMDDGEPLDVDTARSVGAAEGVDWVVLVEIHLVSANGSASVDSARYTFVRVAADEETLRGSFSAGEFDRRRGETLVAAVERVGRNLADSFLDEM